MRSGRITRIHVTNDTSTSEDAPAAAADRRSPTTSRPSAPPGPHQPPRPSARRPEGETDSAPGPAHRRGAPRLVDDGGTCSAPAAAGERHAGPQLRVEEGRAAAFIVNAHNEPVAELHAAVRKLLEAQLLLDALV